MIGESPPQLAFAVEGVDPLLAAAVPTLAIRLRIDSGTRPVRGIALNVRLRIAAERRRYDEAEAERLHDLFGPADEWARSLGSVPWTETVLNVGPFEGHTVVDLRVPCTYDFEVAAAKYLSALGDGAVPLELLFSGMVFYTGAEGRLQTAMIPWDHEASARMPVSVWREAVDSAFPNSAWLRIDRDVFDRLHAYRSRAGLTTWEDALESLLDTAEE